jgi:Tol biopolymer transport system component
VIRGAGTETGGSADADSGLQSGLIASDLSVTPDGRFVLFRSSAANLVPGDTNGVADVFVRDRQLGVTTRVSIAANGGQSPADSGAPDISDDGRYVVFSTRAALVPEDTHTCLAASEGCSDLYVHDRVTGRTSRVSVSTQGTQADADVQEGHISGDGRFVVFFSSASTLAPGDNTGTMDVFLRDLVAGTTVRLSALGGVSASARHGLGRLAGPRTSARLRHADAHQRRWPRDREHTTHPPLAVGVSSLRSDARLRQVHAAPRRSSVGVFESE